VGTDNLFWKRKRKLQRLEDTRSIRPAMLIVCEGTKTEPNYFNFFRATNMTIRTVGRGEDAKNLIDFACTKKEDYDQIWCVFDRDRVPKCRFNGAIDKARDNNIKIAYSNEAFELWYILHFEYLSTGITRKQYCKKLNKLLGNKYNKNDENMYNLLLDRQSTAIKNAKTLLKQYKPSNPADDNPSTTVHLLVTELNRYVK